MRTTRRLALVTCLGLGLFGCTGGQTGPQAGDCFADPPRQLATSPTVGCDEGVYELVAVAALDEQGAYPGLQALSSLAFDRCAAAADEYTGRDVVASDLDIWFHHPSEQSWADGDRQFVCAVTRVDGRPLGGSVAG
ncbi:septum formation family protein [Egicoccus sp. AB-alg2]|uniref:septum formation family protein n=1 Tax=Egicoccus sp. AB-alg2 TaxID=3242693 RepID=UPI00359D5AC1